MRQLLDDFAADRLQAGSLLPREVDLAERFAVSRGVARDVVQALRERHVVTVRHGSGARLLPEEAWNLLDDEVLAILLGREDRTRLRAEIVESLLKLEPEAARLAAERASEEDVAAMERELDRFESDGALPAYVLEEPRVRAQVALHDTLLRAGGNRPLRQLTHPLHVGLAVICHASAGRAARSRLAGDYRAVVEAVRSADPAAAEATTRVLLERVAASLAAG